MSKSLAGGALILGMLSLIVVGWATWPPPPGTADTQAGREPLPLRLVKLREQAMKSMTDGDWCKASRFWEDFQNGVREQPTWGDWQLEAARNLAATKAACEPTSQLVNQVTILDPLRASEEERKAQEIPLEKRISPESLVEYYREGRKIYSVGILRMQGRGMNRGWGLQGEQVFDYRYQVPVQTTVVSNDGTKVIFRQRYGVVEQNLIVTSRTLELHLPDSPLQYAPIALLERAIPTSIPVYWQVKRAAQIYLLADPNAKEALTALLNFAHAAGLKDDRSDDARFIARIEKLTGAIVELDYDRRFGVIDIRIPNEPIFTREELLRLSSNANPLLDYYLFPAAAKTVGDQWTVDARDVEGILSLGVDTDVTGSLALQWQASPTPDSANLLVQPGILHISGWQDGGQQSADVTVLNGKIDFSKERHFVRRATFALDARSQWQSRDHLLFETEQVRDLRISADYEAMPVEESSHE